jgi:glycosyltransferase involved in cell wall biosynthesis
VRRSVAQRLAGGEVDVAVCDFLSASLNFPERSDVPCVLFQHNVESVLWRRQAREERQPVRRAVFRFESARMSRYEAAAVRRFDHVIAVSDADRDAMRDMVPFDRISVVPTGVDTLTYRPAGREPQDGLVLFLGSMDWEPNVDGVEFFCREVWPQVVALVPHARFRVVGRNPLPSILRLASDSVEITGTVPSVLEHLQRAALVVVPLRIGGGTRLKIYESMAAAKAVVSTTIGAEGLDVHDGRDIVLADTAGAFAAAVVRILNDAAERRRIEDAALELARRYDWREVSVTFEQVLAGMMRRRPADSATDPFEATA